MCACGSHGAYLDCVFLGFMSQLGWDFLHSIDLGDSEDCDSPL